MQQDTQQVGRRLASRSLGSVWMLAAALAGHDAVAQTPEPEPAFSGQTEAPVVSTQSSYRAEVVTDQLAGGWSMAFLPDGRYLVAENVGRLRIVSREGIVSEPVANVPPVKVVAAQGFHDVVLDPEFETNGLIYFTYFAPPKGEEAGRWPIDHFYTEVWSKSLAERRVMDLGFETVGKARLNLDAMRLEDVEVLIQGGAERRIVLAPDGTLLVTGADAFRFYESDLDGVEREFTDNPDIRRNFSGRVIRLNRDGTIPADNPWLGRATVPRETFAHGLRDPEGAAIHPQTGELWVTDHGPQGGDEINIVRAGRDYGWPNVSYGVQYDDRQLDGRKNVPVGRGRRSMDGVEEPLYFWVPSVALSGMAFYTGSLMPEWQGNLFVGAMVEREIVRLVLDGDRVVGEERLLGDLDIRIRELRDGPDGYLYALGGNSLLRIGPAD